jgi:endo-1,3(4)-beta-glucanase
VRDLSLSNFWKKFANVETQAINGYYGVLLYATATNNANLRNFARLLVALEQDGSRTYWHMDPAASETARDNPYPEQGLRNLVTIGNLEDWQSGMLVN